MIAIHKHFNKDIYKQSHIAKVTQQNPILLVTDHNHVFLNMTLHYILKANKIPYITSNITHQDHHHHHHHKNKNKNKNKKSQKMKQQRMSELQNQLQKEQQQIQIQQYQKQKQINVFMKLPSLIYADIILSDEQLIDFICDLSISNKKQFIQYSQQKYAIKQMYKIWKIIINWELQHKKSYDQLNIINIFSQQDYHNTLFQHFQTIIAQGIGKILHKKYPNYSKQQLHLQDVFYSDIVLSIIKMIPASIPDQLIRGYFYNLLQFAIKIQQKVDNIEIGQYKQQLEICLVRGQGLKKQQQYVKWNTNWQTFTIILTVSSFLYGYFVKK